MTLKKKWFSIKIGKPLDLIYALFCLTNISKFRLKKDMIVKVNQVAADFRRVSNKQMADTTKRTIRENVSINAQLQKMSEKIVELISDNDKTKLNVCLFFFCQN